ncbi:hypothetical protein B0H14DRAFT_3538962 [Mycena olivaceomarginata]|nr:hypothetical protein B0H14DRAFT_3538962 [Mycena olivaceomarginata]
MRQQRRTQPWMRSILSLVVTTKVVGPRRPRQLRICLGVVRSTALQRGQHEVFELFHTKTLGPPHLKSNHGRSSKTKPSKTAKSEVDIFSAEDPMVEYLHRTVRFITLRGNHLHYSQDGTRPDTRFYVHHLVQDSGSLVGRCARIFCVSRETESEGDVRNFIGPYALKLYNADCGSDCFKDDLIQLARDGQAKNVLSPDMVSLIYLAHVRSSGLNRQPFRICREWYYSDALSVRGLSSGGRQDPTLMPRPRGFWLQSANYDEFVKAFIDFVEGIASLRREKDLLHRDLSIGNVLLSKDIACSPSFLSDAAASAQAILGTSVAFTQRTLEQRIGGLIHDFDMAGRAHPPPEMATGESGQEGLEKAFELAHRLLWQYASSSMAPPHLAAYDLHSLLFVLPVPAQSRKWPLEVLRWANRPVGFSLAELGVLKRGFFQKPLTLRDTLDRTLDGDLWTQDPAFLRFFWALYGALWTRSHEGPDWVDRFYATAGDVQKVLTTEYVTTVSQKEIGDQ